MLRYPAIVAHKPSPLKADTIMLINYKGMRENMAYRINATFGCTEEFYAEYDSLIGKRHRICGGIIVVATLQQRRDQLKNMYFRTIIS